MTETRDDLLPEILRLLRKATHPMTLPEIAWHLPTPLEFDTFDVRNAVWTLVSKGAAAFTPRMYVVMAGRQGRERT